MNQFFTRFIEWFKDPSGALRCAMKLEGHANELKHEVAEIRRELSKPLEEILEDYKQYAKEKALEADFYQTSLDHIGDVLPDMIWMKWADGKYGYANKAIRDGLLFDDKPIGKDDIELGNNAQKFFGANKHNFGSYCTGSDTVTIELGYRKRFIEYGMSGGRPLVLEVYKNVVRNNDNVIIATVGCGRDITENIFTMFNLVDLIASERRERCANKGDQAHEVIDRYLSRYLFENEYIEATLLDFYHQNKDKYNG